MFQWLPKIVDDEVPLAYSADIGVDKRSCASKDSVLLHLGLRDSHQKCLGFVIWRHTSTKRDVFGVSPKNTIEI